MGNWISYICSCGCCGCESEEQIKENQKHKRKLEKIKKELPEDYEEMLANISAPSLMATNKITIVYRLSKEGFESPEEIIKYHGFLLDRNNPNNRLGTGSFATVYKATKIDNGQTVACKIIKLDELNERKRYQQMRDIKIELFILEKVKHPHIVEIYKHVMIDDHVYIMMQFASKGSLSGLVRSVGPFEESVCKVWFAQIASAVQCMHAMNMAHRDLKLGNILVDHNMNLLIADFGLSKVVFRQSKGGDLWSQTYCGTQPYMAPEVSKVKKYKSFPADIYALGVILYAMFNKSYPYRHNNRKIMIADQTQKKWEFSKRIKTQPSEQLCNILSRLLEPVVSKRIKINELCKHAWIANEIDKINKKCEQSKYLKKQEKSQIKEKSVDNDIEDK